MVLSSSFRDLMCATCKNTTIETLQNVLMSKIKWGSKYIPIFLPKLEFKMYLLNMFFN
jgi:hypothetical protein